MAWIPSQPVRQLSQDISELFLEEAGDMLKELKDNRLEVVLIPAPSPRFEGHKVRAVQNRNPEWYSRLYNSHSSFRRELCINAMKRILDDKDGTFRKSPYKYECMIRKEILKRLYPKCRELDKY